MTESIYPLPAPMVKVLEFTRYHRPPSNIVGFCDVLVNGLILKGLVVVEDGEVIDIRFPSRKMKNGSYKKLAYPKSAELYQAIKAEVLFEYLMEAKDGGHYTESRT